MLCSRQKGKNCHLSDNGRIEEAKIKGFKLCSRELPFSLHKRCRGIKDVHIVPMQRTLFSSLFSRAFRHCLHLNHTQNSSFIHAIHRLNKQTNKTQHFSHFITSKCTVIFHITALEVHDQFIFHYKE